ncbi:hypothetical protein VNO80_14256 [Phaseolus coccineus]|uniref:Secreted protein n=1 Tax=Phaseolus coccineus TaxID=3886 RepID=A0AAN9R182_PHACN
MGPLSLLSLFVFLLVNDEIPTYMLGQCSDRGKHDIVAARCHVLFQLKVFNAISTVTFLNGEARAKSSLHPNRFFNPLHY